MNKKTYKVFVDAGHGGSDTGACSNGLIERDINLVMAKECSKVLEEHGVITKLSRTANNQTLGLTQRCDMANKWGADLFVSVHNNAGGGDGAEAIHSIYMGEGKELADSIVNSVKYITGQNIRRVFSKESTKHKGTDYFAVIRQTKMPSVISEGAFLDSKDREVIDTIPEQEKMGRAIAYGILKHLNIPIGKEIESFEDAVDLLSERGVINSPDYWKTHVDFDPSYVKSFFIKVAKEMR